MSDRTQVTVELSPEGADTVVEMLEALQYYGKIGAGASVEIENQGDGEDEWWWDGDGRDRVYSIEGGDVNESTNRKTNRSDRLVEAKMQEGPPGDDYATDETREAKRDLVDRLEQGGEVENTRVRKGEVVAYFHPDEEHHAYVRETPSQKSKVRDLLGDYPKRHPVAKWDADWVTDSVKVWVTLEEPHGWNIPPYVRHVMKAANDNGGRIDVERVRDGVWRLYSYINNNDPSFIWKGGEDWTIRTSLGSERVDVETVRELAQTGMDKGEMMAAFKRAEDMNERRSRDRTDSSDIDRRVDRFING